jgi:hypothetical protein
MRVSQIFANCIGLALPAAIYETKCLAFLDAVTDLFKARISDRVVDPVFGLDPPAADVADRPADRKCVDRCDVAVCGRIDRDLG